MLKNAIHPSFYEYINIHMQSPSNTHEIEQHSKLLAQKQSHMLISNWTQEKTLITIWEWVRTTSHLFASDFFHPSNLTSLSLLASISNTYDGTHSLIQAQNSGPPIFSNFENAGDVNQLFFNFVPLSLCFPLSKLNFSSSVLTLASISCSTKLYRTTEESLDEICLRLLNQLKNLPDALFTESWRKCLSVFSRAATQTTSPISEMIRSSDELRANNTGTCRYKME